MKTYRVNKIKPDDNCTREFLVDFDFILEELEGNEIVYAWPLKLHQLWDYLGDDFKVVVG